MMSKKKKQHDWWKIFRSCVFAVVFGLMFWWGANYGPRFYANDENSWLGLAMVVGGVGLLGLAAVLGSFGFKWPTFISLILTLGLLTAFRITIFVIAVVYLYFLIYGCITKALK